MTVLLYHKRFAPPIKSGVKRHTIRRNRKRQIPVGAALSHRIWEGKGYRSNQIEIAQGKCTAVLPIYVDVVGVLFGQPGTPLLDATIINKPAELDAFAVSDGFSDWADMMRYYEAEKIWLPFSGVLIQWE